MIFIYESTLEGKPFKVSVNLDKMTVAEESTIEKEGISKQVLVIYLDYQTEVFNEVKTPIRNNKGLVKDASGNVKYELKRVKEKRDAQVIVENPVDIANFYRLVTNENN